MQFSKKEEYLRNKDYKLKKIIDSNGHILFKPNKKNQFDTLVEIVISQFISTSAAKSIFFKIKDNFATSILHEKHFENISVEEIKNLGGIKTIIIVSHHSPIANICDKVFEIKSGKIELNL